MRDERDREFRFRYNLSRYNRRFDERFSLQGVYNISVSFFRSDCSTNSIIRYHLYCNKCLTTGAGLFRPIPSLRLEKENYVSVDEVPDTKHDHFWAVFNFHTSSKDAEDVRQPTFERVSKPRLTGYSCLGSLDIHWDSLVESYAATPSTCHCKLS